jgi:hypothetical protein
MMTLKVFNIIKYMNKIQSINKIVGYKMLVYLCDSIENSFIVGTNKQRNQQNKNILYICILSGELSIYFHFSYKLG